jgi:Zn-dependent protease with chaperone function
MSARARPWIDTVKWSWLVKSYGLTLALVTFVEYSNLLGEVLGPWLPNSVGGLRIAGALPWLVLPLLISQLVTTIWLVAVVRIARPPDEPQVAIAAQAIARHFARPSWRTPRIVVGRVAQPQLTSVLGMPLLILPRSGLALWDHQFGPKRSPDVFAAIIHHEIAHVMAWDDLLFVPWFTYTTCALGIWLAGLVLSISGRFDPFALLGHLVLLVGIGLLGYYVVRRREAHADAFAVVTQGTDDHVRSALSVLAHPVGHHRFHFRPRERNEWLSSHGRRFLDLDRIDLGLLAMITIVVQEPFSDLFQNGALKIATNWLTESAVEVLVILTVAGMAIARNGQIPAWRDFAVTSAVCALGVACYEALTAFMPNMVSVAAVFSSLTVGFTVNVVNLWILIVVVTRWTEGVFAAVAPPVRAHLIYLPIIYVLGKSIVERLGKMGFAARTEHGPFRDSPLDFMILLGTYFGAGLLAHGLLLLAIYAWSRRAIRVNRTTCEVCASEVRTPIALACPRCGAALNREAVVMVQSSC